MNSVRPSAPVAAPTRPLLGRPLQILLTIIAGTVVAVIAWTVVARFLHILILLLASFIVAFLLLPLVNLCWLRTSSGSRMRYVASTGRIVHLIRRFGAATVTFGATNVTPYKCP